VRLARLAEANRLGDLAASTFSVQIEHLDADLVSFGHYRPSVWRNYVHTHSFYEVCLVYAGVGSYRNGDRTLSVVPGTVFVARPGDIHEIQSSVDCPLGLAFWGFTLRPRRRANGPARGWWTGLSDPYGALLSSDLGLLPLLLEGLAAEAARPRAGGMALVESLAAAMVIETGRAFAEPLDLTDDRRVAASPESALTARIWQYLRDNLSRPLIVRDIAAQVHLSERHAQRIFRGQTQLSLLTGLRQVRMEQAAHLLLETDEAINEVARHCGYADPRAFSTAFHRFYGQTATSFRHHAGTLQLTDLAPD